MLNRDMDRLAYRVYVTDLLRGLTGGKCERYWDIIDRKPVKPETRTAEEIISHIRRKLEEG